LYQELKEKIGSSTNEDLIPSDDSMLDGPTSPMPNSSILGTSSL